MLRAWVCFSDSPPGSSFNRHSALGTSGQAGRLHQDFGSLIRGAECRVPEFTSSVQRRRFVVFLEVDDFLPDVFARSFFRDFDAVRVRLGTAFLMMVAARSRSG